MRPVGIAFLSLLISASALAQTPAPAAKQSAMKQKTPAASPQPAAYAAMPLADRIPTQSDLIWTGDYNGTSDRQFSTGAVNAVKVFQKPKIRDGILDDADALG